MKIIITAAIVAAVVFVSGSAKAATSDWYRVGNWKSSDISLTATYPYLYRSNYRLIYRSNRPNTWVHAWLICGSHRKAQDMKAHPGNMALTFKSPGGCRLRVLMLGYLTNKTASMHLELEQQVHHIHVR